MDDMPAGVRVVIDSHHASMAVGAGRGRGERSAMVSLSASTIASTAQPA